MRSSAPWRALGTGAALVGASLGAGCGAPSRIGPAASDSATHTASTAGERSSPRPPTAAVAGPRSAPAASTAAESPRPNRLLSPDEARRYMVQLVNLDRASAGLPPVELDPGPATRAGQAHAEDMASHAYLGHWGTDGSVPEQRYTQAGGTAMVMENASCFTDEKPRVLDARPGIDPRRVEETEDMFFHEKPPRDGHRQNILKPWHTRVGIGVAQPVATSTEIPVPCFAQEFVDDYGTYAATPRGMRAGDVLHVEGTVAGPAKFAGIGLARVDTPRPLPVRELNQRRSYAIPQPYQMYWPEPFKTPLPVKVRGASFSIDVPVSDQGRPGMYELSVWAAAPGSTDLVMVSLRTIAVR